MSISEHYWDEGGSGESPRIIITELVAPFVSCICVARGHRFEQAIECYLFQSHTQKELIVLYEPDNTNIQRVKARFASESSIKFVEASPGESGIAATDARCEFVTLWDGSDMHHPDRIRMQLGLTLKHENAGNILNSSIVYSDKLRKGCVVENHIFVASLFIRKKTLLAHMKGGSIMYDMLLKDGQINTISISFLYMHRTNDEFYHKELHSRSQPMATRSLAALNFIADKSFVKTVLQCAAMDKPVVLPTPTILHQIWKTCELEPHSAMVTTRWKELHPCWTYKLWTDVECREFVAAVYPEFEAKYKKFPFPIQRVDAIRYLILNTYGGVYMDLDMVPLKPIDFLVGSTELTVSYEGDCSIVSNAFMASPANHPFLAHVVEDMVTYTSPFKDRNNHVLDTTGSKCVTRLYGAYPERVRVLHHRYFMPLSDTKATECITLQDSVRFYRETYDAYAVHMFEGSWWRTQPDRFNYILPMPVGASPIPKLLHVTPRAPQAMLSIAKIQGLHPDWKLQVWPEHAALAFVKERGTSAQVEAYESQSPVQRSEWFRMFVVSVLGGIFLDTSVDLERSFDELPPYVTAFVPCEKFSEKGEPQIGNYAMGAVAEHPFFVYLLDSADLTTAVRNYKKEGVTILLPPLDGTGARCAGSFGIQGHSA